MSDLRKVRVYRPNKGGAYRFSLDGILDRRQYMSRDQAQRAGIKAAGDDAYAVAVGHHPDGERPA